MDIELENPFGLHAPARLRLDPRVDVASVLERARLEHGLDCNQLVYRGRLLKPSEIIGQFVEPGQTNKIVTHVSERTFRMTPPSSPINPERNLFRARSPDPVGPADNLQAGIIPPRLGFWQQFREYLDFSLVGRLAFFVVILGADAPPSRRIVLFLIAIALYIFQVAMRGAALPEDDPRPRRVVLPSAIQTSSQEPEKMDFVQLAERFVVGLFASLYPGWDPN